MKNSRCADFEPRQLSPLTLAFLGDAVFELLVRNRLVRMGSRPSLELHRLSVQEVCCNAQSKASNLLVPLLTEEETAVFRRGKNARPGHFPKNADQKDYHNATALESLFGYLYLCGRSERLEELFAITVGDGKDQKGDDRHAARSE
mgnify:CR=1 FL=1